MKVVIPGGTGHVGSVLIRHFRARGDEIVLLTRRPESVNGVRAVAWDGETLGAWTKEIDGADVVINLAGRSVNCRYTANNLQQMLDSRVRSTQAVGRAIKDSTLPPKVWLQASTATIYAHSLDSANDEESGVIGGRETGVPELWNKSVEIALAWEEALADADATRTRKVALRSAMTMSTDQGSVFDVLATLAKRGLGGRLGSGNQYVSWIHEHDFARAVQFLIDTPSLEGAVNVCSPNPLPQAEFAFALREALGVGFCINASGWMVELGTRMMDTESELVLKSRRVVPKRLLDAGFVFNYPTWRNAAQELVERSAS